jgi:hypothetical protein
MKANQGASRAERPAIPLVDQAAFKKAQAEPRGKQERLL